MVHFCGERKGREKREGEKEKREERKGGKSQHFQLDVSQVPQSHYGNNQLEISPCLPQLEKAHMQQGDLAQQKINNYKKERKTGCEFPNLGKNLGI